MRNGMKILLLGLIVLVFSACHKETSPPKETPQESQLPSFSVETMERETDSVVEDTETSQETTSEMKEWDLSLYGVPDASVATGIYQLDLAYWTEASKQELLGGYNPFSYLSLGTEGKVYLMLGRDVLQEGTLLMAKNPENLSQDEPNCLLQMEDGSIRGVYYLQMTMTIHDMEEAALTEDAPKGLSGSTWTYGWINGEFWTEESLRDDIG